MFARVPFPPDRLYELLVDSQQCLRIFKTLKVSALHLPAPQNCSSCALRQRCCRSTRTFSKQATPAAHPRTLPCPVPPLPLPAAREPPAGALRGRAGQPHSGGGPDRGLALPHVPRHLHRAPARHAAAAGALGERRGRAGCRQAGQQLLCIWLINLRGPHWPMEAWGLPAVLSSSPAPRLPTPPCSSDHLPPGSPRVHARL
jgi:hypothetical protein